MTANGTIGHRLRHAAATVASIAGTQAAAVAMTVAALTAINAVIRLAARRGRHTRTKGYSMNETVIEVGPVDVAVIKFVGNRFTGEVTPALLDLAGAGIVRVLDALFVYRDTDGGVGSVEIGDLGPQLRPAFVDVNGSSGVGLLDAEDIADVGADLEPGTSALLLVFENTWAARFSAACRRAGGELVDIARVPSQAVAGVLAPLSVAGPMGA